MGQCPVFVEPFDQQRGNGAPRQGLHKDGAPLETIGMTESSGGVQRLQLACDSNANGEGHNGNVISFDDRLERGAY